MTCSIYYRYESNSIDLHVYYVSIVYNAVEGALRLRGGETPFEGRVEIYLGGKWSRIGNSGWDLDDAAVACRQLGFEGASFAPRGSYFGPGEQDLPVNLDHVRCTGGESSLLECAGSVFNLSRHGNSVPGHDAGVLCAGKWSLFDVVEVADLCVVVNK